MATDRLSAEQRAELARLDAIVEPKVLGCETTHARVGPRGGRMCVGLITSAFPLSDGEFAYMTVDMSRLLSMARTHIRALLSAHDDAVRLRKVKDDRDEVIARLEAAETELYQVRRMDNARAADFEVMRYRAERLEVVLEAIASGAPNAEPECPDTDNSGDYIKYGGDHLHFHLAKMARAALAPKENCDE